MDRSRLSITIFSALLVVALFCLVLWEIELGKPTPDYLYLSGAFPIGIFWQPPPQNSSNDKYAELKNMNANFIVGTNGVADFNTNKAALPFIEANDLKLLVYDSRFRALPANNVPDSLSRIYKDHPAVLGYHLYDEPAAEDMVKLAAITERFKMNNPDHMVFVNLFPNYATMKQLFGTVSIAGSEVSPNQSLGQTFQTAKHETQISTIQLGIVAAQWEADEKLTLTLWNSPEKTTQIAQHTLFGNGDNWPLFTLDAKVKPSTTYYIELTHSGGGDQSVGRVVHSNPGEKWLLHGNAYINGSPIDADLWFTVNQQIRGNSYEDYVYRWVRTEPDILVFDYYPFGENNNAEISDSYYDNLEIIRRQALGGSIDFWTYIQSVGIKGMLRSPSQNELRFLIYSNLVYGAKGYIYFTYTTPVGEGHEAFHDGIIQPDGSRSPLYEWAQELNHEVLNLGPALLSMTSQEVYHTGQIPRFTTKLPEDFFMQPVDQDAPLIIGYYHDDRKRKYIMIVNRDWRNSATVQMRMANRPAAIQEISKLTGEETATDYNPATGIFSAELAPGEGRLYVMPKRY